MVEAEDVEVKRGWWAACGGRKAIAGAQCDPRPSLSPWAPPRVLHCASPSHARAPLDTEATTGGLLFFGAPTMITTHGAECVPGRAMTDTCAQMACEQRECEQERPMQGTHK